MKKTPLESVGENFNENLIRSARDQTLAAIQEAAKKIQPGMTEELARSLIKDLLRARGCEKSWHAPQIRFGINTLRAFGEPGQPDVVLGENDLYFLDLGPLFQNHEGDVSRTFALGNNPEMRKIAEDVETIWKKVRDRWFQTVESGAQLYSYARQIAQEMGWVLSLHEANGHRIADFPHVTRQRGSVEELDFRPSPLKWILEIQIRHPSRPFGAFYEDLLV